MRAVQHVRFHLFRLQCAGLHQRAEVAFVRAARRVQRHPADDGGVSAEYATQIINGWLAYARVGNTYKMSKEMLKSFEEFNIKFYS